MKILKKYLKKYLKYLIVGPFFKLLEAVFELFIPLVTAQIIDKGIPSGSTSYILSRLGIMAGLGVAGLTFSLICQYYAAVCGYGFGTDIRNDLMKRVMRLRDPESCGLSAQSLAVRINYDTYSLQTGVNMFIRLMSRIPFIVIGSTIMAMLIDVKISAIFWLSTVIIFLVLMYISRITVGFHLKAQRLTDSIATQSREALSGMRVIRAFGQQKKRCKTFDEESDELQRFQAKAATYSAALNPMAVVITNIAIVAILYFAGGEVDTGNITQGEAAALVSYMTQICLGLIVFANLLGIFTKASASLSRVEHIFELETLDESEPSLELTEVESIEFRDVSLRYPGAANDVLSGISFTLRKGECLGIIGGVGSGKTTILKLITAGYSPTSGQILINGNDIALYGREQLARFTAHCFQYPRFYSDSIFENMRRADETLTEERATELLKMARAWDFVSRKSAGIHEKIAEGGRNLSGGQRQRLNLARTLAHRHDILLLDDATCALDYATELEVLGELAARSDKICTVIVSQRAATLRYADKILVLDDGKQAGLGNHAELMQACPIYRETAELSGYSPR